MSSVEVNIDGLVGPTHNYAGMSVGNRASMSNAGAASNPRAAARQGIAKMRHVHRLGLTQGVMAPQERPDPAVLRQIGLRPDATIADVASIDPSLVPMVMSASSMWAANAATVTPSVDAADGRLHLTPANLSSTAHRSFEHTQTYALLQSMFSDRQRFSVHPALPSALPFADEGAANHGRFAPSHGAAGVHWFVYGRDATDPERHRFPRRQTRLAGELISQSHGHDPARVVRTRQAAAAIDAGAFHNDVVSVANGQVLFAHADAFDDMAELRATLERLDVRVVEVSADDVSIGDAISSYLFNSQLVTLPDTSMALIAPLEVEQTPSTQAYLASAVADPGHPIDSVHTLDLRQSMRNGGGPACLRLRVVMTDAEIDAVRAQVIVDDARLDELEAWVDRHYRDELTPDDLADPALAEESRRALDELTQILSLGSVYPFQR